MRILFSLFCLLLFCQFVDGQNNFIISKPELSYSDSKLSVRFDITGCQKDDYLRIILIAQNAKGDTIKPVFIEGDLGKISCGLGKLIIWDLEKDKLRLDEEISVQIKGELITPPVTEPLYVYIEKLTRGKVLASSIFVPGLGQKKASGRPAYFIFSAMFYGGVGSTIYLNNESSKLKKAYINSSGSDRDILYEDWQKAYNLAVYSAAGTAGIWVINMLWSAVIPIREKDKRQISFYFSPSINKDLFLGARISF